MPPLRPIKRRKLIYYFRQLGFEGPFPGKKHEWMQRGESKFRIPNPHMEDISSELLAELLKQAGITRKEWEELQ